MISGAETGGDKGKAREKKNKNYMRKGLEMSFKHLQIKLREKMVKINCTAGEDFPSVVMP